MFLRTGQNCPIFFLEPQLLFKVKDPPVDKVLGLFCVVFVLDDGEAVPYGLHNGFNHVLPLG